MLNLESESRGFYGYHVSQKAATTLNTMHKVKICGTLSKTYEASSLHE